MKKAGIFGGSFDPVHNAHVKTVEYVKEKLELDEVFVIPANIPPHKQEKHMAAPEHRMNMCRLAFSHIPNVKVSDIEIASDEVSYTFKTLQKLCLKYSGRRFYLICGGDMFVTLLDWKNSDEIFSLADIVGIPRNEETASELKEYSKELTKHGASTHVLDHINMTESSTAVRSHLEKGESVSDMLPLSVERYISENGLYRS